MNPRLIGDYIFLAAIVIIWLPKKNEFLKKHERQINFLIMFFPSMYILSLSYGVTRVAILGFLDLAAYAIIYWPKKNDFMKKHKILINCLAILCLLLYITYLIWFVEPM